jgi:hypothetical protein
MSRMRRTLTRAICIFGLLATAVLLIIPLPASTVGTNYAVKAGGGGNFTTIQACATAMAAGDTCTVFAGTYNESVTVSAGGVGAYKTITVNGSDVVNVFRFTINSHVKIIGNCTPPATIGTCGFSIQNTSSPTTTCVSVPAGTTDFYIVNNVMYACGGINEGTSSPSDHGFIQGNTLSYIGTTSSATPINTGPGLTIYGNYHLIENNDISHVSDGFHFAGSHNVFRKNTMHDTYDTECVSGGNGGNCHIDFIECEPALASQYNVVEGQTESKNIGANAHGYLWQGDACGGQCFNVIMRFNLGEHVSGGIILDDNAFSSTNPGFYNVKSYNNSWVDHNSVGSQFGVGAAFTHNSIGGAVINNLFYYPQAMSDFNPYETDSSTVGTFSVGHNLAFCTGSPCNLHGKVYGSGNFTDDPGNKVANPLFINYANNDFGLLPASPALAAGTYLTTVASSDSGSGTSLVVNDAGFFQDGSGIPGVSADCIAVTTVPNHVCITAVNYQTKTLTLASSTTRSAGDPVWLYSDSTGKTVLIGIAPNIGMTLDSSQASGPPAPPTSLAASVN